MGIGTKTSPISWHGLSSKQTTGCLGSYGCSYRVNTFSMFQIYSLVMLPMHHRCLSHGFISFFLTLCKRSFLRSSPLPPAQQACRPIDSASISICLQADLSKQCRSVSLNSCIYLRRRSTARSFIQCRFQATLEISLSYPHYCRSARLQCINDLRIGLPFVGQEQYSCAS